MPTDDRDDQQFERALARHLSNASPDSTCPDAETLAAYHERTLSLQEMARCKQHIAGCVRCQEALDLVEQTENLPAEEWEHQNEVEPVEQMLMPSPISKKSSAVQQDEELRPGAPTHSVLPAQISMMRARPKWRWLVPAGAIAAGVIVWIGVREIRNQRLQQLEIAQVAQNRSPITPAPSPQSVIVERDRKEAPLSQKADKESPSQQVPASPSPVLVAPKNVPSIAPSSAGDMIIGKRKDSLPAVVGGNATSPQPAAPVSGYVLKSLPKESASRSVNATASAGAAPNPPAEKKAENERVQVPSSSEVIEVQSAPPAFDAASSQIEMSKTRAVPGLLQLATSDHRYIVAPGEKHAWRLGDSGRIERTTDGGKTWRLQISGATADLTAGSATSDKVCWAVGKAGTLLLTTDGGKHWKLLSSPITEDLGGIHATDAVHASIWDVPNRKSFETNDGGVTWQRIANE